MTFSLLLPQLAELDELLLEKPLDLNLEDLRKYVMDSDKNLFVYKEKEIIAFLALRDEFPEFEIDYLYVKKDCRGRGIGKRLLCDVLNNLKDIGYTLSFIEVSSENAIALSLYKSVGYEQYRVRNGYYPTSDALMLKKTISGENYER